MAMDPIELRQLIGDLIEEETEATPGAPLVSTGNRNCNAVNLRQGGIIRFSNGDLVTLTADAAFIPSCTPVSPPAIIANGGGAVDVETQPSGVMPTENGFEYSNFLDPFYASTFPQCYALAATTVVAYTLVIMLFITPRSFLDGGVVVLGRKGFTTGGTGTNIGGRPWLQKVAALSVAISLSIATGATFAAAEEQYRYGIENAKLLQDDVLLDDKLKIIRIISNTFLWLAQAQTLIRLFPRQREKVIIKWTAFALITLDVIFQCLNSFQYQQRGAMRPTTFTDAVPALSYLFALALGVLYAAWVIYYSLMKKRYAFYHPQMKNMCLVAVLSLLSILVPVVFFILDISKPEFTGWGDYVRWVGAAAASVIVWEWVERIEALEREEKKDGILGREVFDGDEMLEIASADRARRRKKSPDGSSGSGSSGKILRHDHPPTTGRNNLWPAVANITARYRSRPKTKNSEKPGEPATTQSTNNDRIRFLQPPLWPSRPAPAVTPISRTDTASAASTVYAIRYHPLTETTSRTTPPPVPNTKPVSRRGSTASSHHSDDESGSSGPAPPSQLGPTIHAPRATTPSENRWRFLARGLPFQRTRREDEERAASAERPPPSGTKMQADDTKWDIRNRFEEFAVSQAEKLREKIRPAPDTDSLPITVIPAPPRRGAALAQLLEEEEMEPQRNARRDFDRRNSSGSGPISPIPPAQQWAAATAGSRTPLNPPTSHRRTGSITIIAAPTRRESEAAEAGASASRLPFHEAGNGTPRQQ